MPETLEDLTTVTATRSPHGYLASPLSDNIHLTDEGYLIVVGCPIARTGWQKYAVKDLPRERAADLGVDVSNPEASISLYRPAKEVFNPEFLASLNGKPLTDGHPPDGEFVNPENYKKYSCGHIQNVRKGVEPLEDGEWPVIADLVISAEPLISKVRNKTARELSLGYDFSIDREGDKIIQCSMLGNHNAVVPRGRAGDLIRIEDAAPVAELGPTRSAASSQAFSPPTDGIEVGKKEAHADGPKRAYDAIVVRNPYRNKENHPVAEKKRSWLRSFMGKHLIELARATDADPEEIMDAAEAMQEEAADKRTKDDAANEFQSTGDEKYTYKIEGNLIRRSDGLKSDDPFLGAAGRPDLWPKDLLAKVSKGKDGEEHDDELMEAMDRALDRAATRDAKSRDRRGRVKDSNVAALKTLLDEFLTEEEEEPEHSDMNDDEPEIDDDEPEIDPAELEAELAGEATDDEECPDCGMAMDECECPGEIEVESGEEVMDAGEPGDPDATDPDDDEDQGERAYDRSKAKDRARATDGALAALRALRPVIARSPDRSVRSAFNAALDSVTKVSRTTSTTDGYSRFASAARARDRAPQNPNPRERGRAADGAADPITKMQDFYNTAHKGGK